MSVKRDRSRKGEGQEGRGAGPQVYRLLRGTATGQKTRLRRELACDPVGGSTAARYPAPTATALCSRAIGYFLAPLELRWRGVGLVWFVLLYSTTNDPRDCYRVVAIVSYPAWPSLKIPDCGVSWLVTPSVDQLLGDIPHQRPRLCAHAQSGTF